MIPALKQISRRSMLRQPWLFFLSVLGVALGVGVFVAMRLANQSAGRAFELSTEAVTGRATHHLVAGPAGVPEGFYRELRVNLGVRTAAPVVEENLTLPAAPGRHFQLLGVDPFAEAAIRPHLGQGNFDLDAFLSKRGGVLLTDDAATSLGLSQGEIFTAQVAGRTQQLTVVGILKPADERSRRLSENILVTDISNAQRLTGRTGRLDRIDLVLSSDEAQRLEPKLPAALELESATSRSESLAQMTRAFTLNLTALSLLALVVGMFLIYNTMTFSVVRRRPLIGTLRALGVTRSEIFSLVVGESMIIGVLGTLLGVSLGALLARFLVDLVTRTINDLYFSLNVQVLHLDVWTLCIGAGLGVIATALAALLPAYEATRAPPTTVLKRSSSEERTRRVLPLVTLTGALACMIGGAILILFERSMIWAFAGFFILLFGASLFSPLCTQLLASAARHLPFGPLGRLASGGIRATLSRTSVAVAALSMAVATAAAVGLMVGSFRQTVIDWLDTTLMADVYVSAPSSRSRTAEVSILDPELVERFSRAPAASHTSSIYRTVVSSPSGPLELVALDYRSLGTPPYRLKEGEPAEVWGQFRQPDVVVISEALSFHRGIKVGESLRIRTDKGERSFRVIGIYYEYTSDSGVALMSWETFKHSFEPRGITGFALYTASGSSTEALVKQLEEMMPDESPAVIRPTHALKKSSIEIFDRTFTVTQVLRVLAVGVAFVGVLSALMALQLDRARELATLRALGMLPSQLWKLVLFQTGLLGAIAGALSIPVSLLMASVLTQVINKRSFGWSIELRWQWDVMLQSFVVAVFAAVLAGLYPAYRMSRQPPALALKEEG